MTPFEIIGAPFTVWLAPLGTAFPLINAAPGVTWNKIGTNGTRNYSEEGVKVMHAQSMQMARPAGATGPVKAFLDSEDFKVSLTLWDMTLEQYALALNGNTVTTTAAGVATAGFKKVGLSRKIAIKEYAMLVRGPSAYDEAFNAQFEVPRVVHTSSPETVFRKGVPAAVACEFSALEDLTANDEELRFGVLRSQHQAPI